MEPEGSLPCSQEPSTGPYPEPYCHALGDRRRVLDWQLDLLLKYNTSESLRTPSGLQLTIHSLTQLTH
jgi:hypothetical protein